MIISVVALVAFVLGYLLGLMQMAARTLEKTNQFLVMQKQNERIVQQHEHDVAAVIHLHQQMRAAGLNVETGHKLHES